MKFIFSTPTWVVSGVNSFTRRLMLGLERRGHEVELLVIRQGPADSPELPLPTDVNVQHLQFDTTKSWWQSRWDAFKNYLHDRAPAVYLPNYDFENSAVIPALDAKVCVLGVVHSDDPDHFEHLQRCGRYWDAAIAVSQHLFGEMIRLAPEVQPRAHLVPYGVPLEVRNPQTGRSGTDELRILYTGRFNEQQKRVSDLPKIAQRLHARGVAFRLTLVGNGPEAERLRTDLASLIGSGHVHIIETAPHDDVLRMYRDYDCLVLPSAYEGLPLALLEAMGSGCVPVVSDIRSGIPDVVRHGQNGYLVPVGDIDGFAARCAALQQDDTLRKQMSEAAFATIDDGPFSIDHVCSQYEVVARGCLERAATGQWVRPTVHRPGSWTGAMLAPARLQISPDAYYSLKWQFDCQAEEIESLKKNLAGRDRITAT
jgi:glycosyltransferase involved in cell wall biosynthesis